MRSTYAVHIVQEANQIEAIEAELEHDPEEVWNMYAEPRSGPWKELLLPVLKRIPAMRLAEETGLATSTVKAARNGRTLPHGRNREALTHAAAAFARERLRELGLVPPSDDLAACAAFLDESVRQPKR